MKIHSVIDRVMPKARALGVAIALAFGASASMAGIAQVYVNGFSATTDVPGGYVGYSGQSQQFTANVLDGGGAHGADTDSYAYSDWYPSFGSASTPRGNASIGNVSSDGGAQPYLRAEAQGTPRGTYGDSVPNTAEAFGFMSSSLNLLDENFEATAGNITFLIDYTLQVDSPDSSASDFANAIFNILAYVEGSVDRTSLQDQLESINVAGGVGTKTGTFSLTLALLADDFAFIGLDGNAFASASTVTEPGALALAGGGLLAMVLVRRRRQVGAVA